MSDPIPTFDYFVVRLNRTTPDLNRITGLVERLGSGEKQPFDTAEHLALLLSTWSGSDLHLEDDAATRGRGQGRE